MLTYSGTVFSLLNLVQHEQRLATESIQLALINLNQPNFELDSLMWSTVYKLGLSANNILQVPFHYRSKLSHAFANNQA